MPVPPVMDRQNALGMAASSASAVVSASARANATSCSLRDGLTVMAFGENPPADLVRNRPPPGVPVRCPAGELMPRTLRATPIASGVAGRAS
jgi:hypothetical protein